MSSVYTPDEAKAAVAANIQAEMLRQDLTQGDLARATKREDEDLQTTRNRISRYLNAKSIPDAADLANIAEALGVSVDSLLARRRKKTSRQSA